MIQLQVFRHRLTKMMAFIKRGRGAHAQQRMSTLFSS